MKKQFTLKDLTSAAGKVGQFASDHFSPDGGYRRRQEQRQVEQNEQKELMRNALEQIDALKKEQAQLELDTDAKDAINYIYNTDPNATLLNTPAGKSLLGELGATGTRKINFDDKRDAQAFTDEMINIGIEDFDVSLLSDKDKEMFSKYYTVLEGQDGNPYVESIHGLLGRFTSLGRHNKKLADAIRISMDTSNWLVENQFGSAKKINEESKKYNEAYKKYTYLGEDIANEEHNQNVLKDPQRKEKPKPQPDKWTYHSDGNGVRVINEKTGETRFIADASLKANDIKVGYDENGKPFWYANGNILDVETFASPEDLLNRERALKEEAESWSIYQKTPVEIDEIKAQTEKLIAEGKYTDEQANEIRSLLEYKIDLSKAQKTKLLQDAGLSAVQAERIIKSMDAYIKNIEAHANERNASANNLSSQANERNTLLPERVNKIREEINEMEARGNKYKAETDEIRTLLDEREKLLQSQVNVNDARVREIDNKIHIALKKLPSELGVMDSQTELNYSESELAKQRGIDLKEFRDLKKQMLQARIKLTDAQEFQIMEMTPANRDKVLAEIKKLGTDTDLLEKQIPHIIYNMQLKNAGLAADNETKGLDNQYKSGTLATRIAKDKLDLELKDEELKQSLIKTINDGLDEKLKKEELIKAKINNGIITAGNRMFRVEYNEGSGEIDVYEINKEEEQVEATEGAKQAKEIDNLYAGINLNGMDMKDLQRIRRKHDLIAKKKLFSNQQEDRIHSNVDVIKTIDRGFGGDVDYNTLEDYAGALDEMFAIPGKKGIEDFIPSDVLEANRALLGITIEQVKALSGKTPVEIFKHLARENNYDTSDAFSNTMIVILASGKRNVDQIRTFAQRAEDNGRYAEQVILERRADEAQQSLNKIEDKYKAWQKREQTGGATPFSAAAEDNSQ